MSFLLGLGVGLVLGVILGIAGVIWIAAATPPDTASKWGKDQ